MKFKASPMAEPYIFENILALLKGKSKNSKVLDLASGQGYLAEKLDHLGFTNIYTADITDKNFKLNKLKFNFRQVDANSALPYKTSQFDVVISSETIEHLENPRGFMREVRRILKPGGLFILSTPAIENIVSRLYFLLTGRLAFHTTRDYQLSGHIAITPTWLLEIFADELGYKKNSRHYTCFYLPVLKWRFTNQFFLNRFWGWIVIYSFTSPTNTSESKSQSS